MRVLTGTPCTSHEVTYASVGTFKFLSTLSRVTQQLRGTSVTLNVFDLMLF